MISIVCVARFMFCSNLREMKMLYFVLTFYPSLCIYEMLNLLSLFLTVHFETSSLTTNKLEVSSQNNGFHSLESKRE